MQGTGFLENVEERPSEANPSRLQTSNASPLVSKERPIALNDIGFEDNNDVIHMGKYG